MKAMGLLWVEVIRHEKLLAKGGRDSESGGDNLVLLKQIIQLL